MIHWAHNHHWSSGTVRLNAIIAADCVLDTTTTTQHVDATNGLHNGCAWQGLSAADCCDWESSQAQQIESHFLGVRWGCRSCGCGAGVALWARGSKFRESLLEHKWTRIRWRCGVLRRLVHGAAKCLHFLVAMHSRGYILQNLFFESRCQNPHRQIKTEHVIKNCEFYSIVCA
jgi:hypothetical protein